MPFPTLPQAATASEVPPARWVSPDEIEPWSRNPRAITDEAVEAVAASIARFGFGAPIIARTTGEVIAGHTRLRAAKQLGLTQVPVRFLDLDEDEAHALALADNRTGELTGWSDGLGAVMQTLTANAVDLARLGWSDAELQELLAAPPVELDEEDDDAPAVDETAPPDSQLGEVYALGPHRLVCGDATDAATWAALMEGAKADALWADPPFGVSYVGGTVEALTIQNDDLDAAGLETLLRASLGHAAAACRPGAAWYVKAPAGPQFHQFGTVLTELEVWRQTLVWAKDRLVLGRSDYHYRHEAIFYGWVPGAAHYFVDDRKQDTLLEVARQSVNREHPTMTPVALIERCLANSTKPGWTVLDPFGGSGSTLIAAAALGRQTRLLELDPRYADVIRRRWTTWARKHDRDPGDGALEARDG